MEQYKAKFNNFHFYFPGEYYRSLKPSEESSKIVGDLDKIIAQTRFDVKRFGELRKRLTDMARDAIIVYKRDLTPEEEKRKNEIIKQEIEVNMELDKMMEPLYQALLKKGYTERQLTR